MEGKGTFFFERLEIKHAIDSMVYTSWVKDQNKGAGIRYRQTETTDTSRTFENLQHDFPKTIHYIKTGASTMEVFVFEYENSLPREEHFFFIRKDD